MPITRLARLLITGLVVALAGCGSQTTQQRDRADVTDLAGVLHRYNSATVHNLSQQAAICRTAWSETRGVAALAIHGQGMQQKQASLLDSARADAIAGFRDCARAAEDLNYPLMVRAQARIAAANTQISRARSES